MLLGGVLQVLGVGYVAVVNRHLFCLFGSDDGCYILYTSKSFSWMPERKYSARTGLRRGDRADLARHIFKTSNFGRLIFVCCEVF
jgi:hypothetical protein